MKPLHLIAIAVLAAVAYTLWERTRMGFDRALDVIKQHEGLRLGVYKDSAGLPTIGYGHLIKPGEHFTTITQDTADSLLRTDLASIADQIKPAIKVKLSESEWAACLSFAFNVGPGAFRSSTLLKKINAGDKKGAADEFMKWNKARQPKTGMLVEVAGLTNRRSKERELFLA